MELPEKKKEKSVEIARANTCYICNKKSEIKDEIYATSCCKKFICDGCSKIAQATISISKQITINPLRRNSLAGSVEPLKCPSCNHKYKVIPASFAPTIFDFIRDGDFEEVKKFLSEENLINLEGEDSNGDTPLTLAAKFGNRLIVKALIERGAVFDHPVKNYSPLHYAARCGYDSVVSYFLMHAERDTKHEKEKAKFIADVKNDDNETPLMCACKASKVSAIRVLLGSKADPTLKNRWGEDSFDVARMYSDEKVKGEILGLLAAHSKKSN